MAELGRAALVVSLGLAVYALVAGAVRRARGRRRLADSARNALIACFGSTLVAAAVLASALVRHDFSFVYVASHTNRTLPTVYALTAFWGGQEGSLLLWLLVLTGYGALAVALNRRLLRDLIVWVVPVLAGIATFFAFVLVAVASPFDTQTRRSTAPASTPSLQNPYMVAHPPMLYLGYVGLSIPFAFAAGALLSGPHRRALDRRDAPLDARRVDVPRLRPAARRALGVRRGRLGRLLRLGSGRERRADAVARRDRVPALGDDPGAQGDAEGLEHGPRRARVRAVRVRHVPDALGRRQLDPLVREEPDRRLVPRVRRHLVALLA